MGLDIDILWLTVLLFGCLGALLLLGLPMAFCTGSLAVIFLYVFGTGSVLNMLPSRVFPFMTDYQLSAVPLFIFMAAVLEKAGIIEELFDVIYKWLGAVKGGLASATVIAGMSGFAAGSPRRFSSRVAGSPCPPSTRTIAPRWS